MFPAGAGIDGVEALAGPLDVVESLAELSLVHVVEDEDGEPRTRSSTPPWTWALEQLAVAGEADAAYAGLVCWCAAQSDPGRDDVVAGLEWLFGDPRRSGPELVEPALDLTRRFVPHAVASRRCALRKWLAAGTGRSPGVRHRHPGPGAGPAHHGTRSRFF